MTSNQRHAVLYRMASDRHLCPFGLKARDLLVSSGFEVEDRLLKSREEIDAFKANHGVKTTPQVFINGDRIGGYDALRQHLGYVKLDAGILVYLPIISVFAVAGAMALAASHAAFGAAVSLQAAEWFIAFAMCLLALLKLRDIEGFTNGFLGYDLLAQRYVPYAYFYPFAEAVAGILMIGHWLPWIAIPLALFIGGIGAVSVLKAVYVDRRELKCACVGGDSRVPLGLISLTENVMMVAMAIWMIVR